MIIDYHMHLERDDHSDKCRYTPDRVRLYVESARARGTDEIGISEHCNRFDAFQPAMQFLLEADPQDAFFARSFKEKLDEYVDGILAAKREGLPVKLSLEVDYLPGKESLIKEALDGCPFDYIIGSVHFLDTWAIDASPTCGWPTVDVDQAYIDYFHALKQAAASGLFDLMAHPDLIKKFGHKPSFPLDELYDEVAIALAEAGVAAEISSAGLHKPIGELYPSQRLLERFFDRGVPITLGSDAHEPRHVSQDLDKAVAAARQAGYSEIARFDERRRTLVPMG